MMSSLEQRKKQTPDSFVITILHIWFSYVHFNLSIHSYGHTISLLCLHTCNYVIKNNTKSQWCTCSDLCTYKDRLLISHSRFLQCKVLQLIEQENKYELVV